jgi:putative tryptophan/tyrosine transport system substrate-binding protein
MNRKLLWLLAVFLLASIRLSEAQQPKKVARLGYISATGPATDSTRSEAIRTSLRELGYIEGQNIAIEYRYAEGKRDRYSDLLAQLVRHKVELIVVAGGDPLIRAAMNATKSIPIVMTGGGADPVEAGLVESLARPAATRPGLQTFPLNSVGSVWTCSKKLFPNLFVSRFSTTRSFRPAYST